MSIFIGICLYDYSGETICEYKTLLLNYNNVLMGKAPFTNNAIIQNI